MTLGYVFLSAGLAVLAFAWRLGKRFSFAQVLEKEEEAALKEESVLFWEEWRREREELLKKLEELRALFESGLAEKREEAALSPEEVRQQRICAAFEAGKSVEALAREFGRGKGEIELILNLRRKSW